MNTPVVSALDLAQALEALVGATEDSRILAGGTDLMVEFESGRTRPDRIVDIWRVEELRGIDEEEGGVRFGALTTCGELLASKIARDRAGLLVESAREVGAVQIQNRATLGGNLGTASPAADLNPVLLALSATVRLCSTAGTREFAVGDFLTGYRSTLRRPDELIESIFVPARPAGERTGWRKVGTRRAQSISKVVVAASVITSEGVVQRVVAGAGSVSAKTVPLPSLGAELVGKQPSPELIRSAARRAARHDCAPIDDVRSTARYRREVLARTLGTLLSELCSLP